MIQELINRIKNALPSFDTVDFFVFENKETEKFYKFLDFSEESEAYSLFDARLGDAVVLFKERETQLKQTSVPFLFEQTDYFALFAFFSDYNADNVAQRIYQVLNSDYFVTAKLSANKANIIQSNFPKTANEYLDRTGSDRLVKLSFEAKTNVSHNRCLTIIETMDCFSSENWTNIYTDDCEIVEGLELFTASQTGAHTIKAKQSGAITVIEKDYEMESGDKYLLYNQLQYGYNKVVITQPDGVNIYIKLNILPCSSKY